MKKRILSSLITLTLCFLCVLPVFAVTPRPLHIIDEYEVFNDAEFNELEEDAAAVESRYGVCVMFCITDDTGTADTYEYGQSVYEAQTTNEDGILLIVNMTDKLYSFYSCGEAETIFPEDIQDSVLWTAYNEPDSYFDGVKQYLQAAESRLNTSGISSSVTTDNASVTVEPDLPTERLLPLVVDKADVLSSEEETALTERLTEISDRFELDLAVVTVTDFGGKTPEAFADDFYDYNGYGRGSNADGALVVFKPGKEGERRLQISTCGKAIDAFSDSDISYIIDSMKEYVIDGDYIGAFNTFADKSERELEAEFEPSVSPVWIPVCLIAGFAAALIIMKIRTSSLTSVRKKADAGDYANNIAITDRSDVFLFRNVNKTPIPKSSSSSSTHTSSSGRTHGGGGSSF